MPSNRLTYVSCDLRSTQGIELTHTTEKTKVVSTTTIYNSICSKPGRTPDETTSHRSTPRNAHRNNILIAVTVTTPSRTRFEQSEHQVVNSDTFTSRRRHQHQNVVTAAPSFQVYVKGRICNEQGLTEGTDPSAPTTTIRHNLTTKEDCPEGIRWLTMRQLC